jgi:hypothetical protein
MVWFNRRTKEPPPPYFYKWKIVHISPDRWEVWKLDPCGSWWRQSSDLNFPWFYSEFSAKNFIEDEEQIAKYQRDRDEKKKNHIVTEKYFG